MRLEDRDITQDREQLDREAFAERRRIMREASNAFAARAQHVAAQTEATGRVTILSAKRQAEVTLARAIVAAFGDVDVYGAGAPATIGGRS